MSEKIRLSYLGRVTPEGELRLNNKRQMEAEVKRALTPKPGKTTDVWVTIERKVKSRSTRQNRYYFGIIVPIVTNALADQGLMVDSRVLDQEDVHEMLKNTFLKRKVVNEETGEFLGEFNLSTTKLTTIEFMEYVAEIQQWAAEKLNCYIPDPVENLREAA